VTNPLFLYKNWVTFESNTPCLSEFSSWRSIHFVKNRPIQMNRRDTCISWMKIIYVRSRSVQHIVFLWEQS
jgi:hypothetical protein